MKIQIFTLCDYAQSNSGKLTIVGTFNRIYADKFPFPYPASISVVAKISSKEACDGDFSFVATSPSGEPILAPLQGKYSIKNPENNYEEKSFDFCLAANNITFKEAGTYLFKFEAGGLIATQELYLVPRA